MSRTVLIAGAGPTGLMLACELASAGVRAVVLERAEAPRDRSWGMAVHGRTLEVFEQRGLADRVEKEHSFVWPRTPFALMWLDLGAVDERDHTVSYPQWRTERLLEQRARELGVEIHRGHEVAGVAQDAEGVTADVRCADGTRQFRGAYLVGCDGPDSPVRTAAGIAFPGAGVPYHGIFADVTPSPELDNSFAAGLHPRGMAAAMPIEAQVTRLMAIELGVEPPPAAPEPDTAELRALFARITGSEPEVPRPHWVGRFGGRTALAERYREGRVLIAGDAAHVLFISGTQALNAGIQDAVNLGWKLAAEVQGRAPAGLLDSYEAERRPVGEQVCRHSRATLALLDQATGRMAPLRELFGEFLQFESVNRFLLQLPVSAVYPMGRSGDEEEGRPAHPLLGRRVDLAQLPAEVRAPAVTALSAGRGVLVDPPGGPAADFSAWQDRVAVVRTGSAGACLLVRPDGYVAHADSAEDDLDGLLLALKTWFGESVDHAGDPRP